MRRFAAVIVTSVLAAVFGASVLAAEPASAVTGVRAVPECMTPVSGGTGPGSTWDVAFGWEAEGPDGEPPLVIPAGDENQVLSGTLVSGDLPTVFTKPAVRADGSLRHPVWPLGYEQRTGRTGWWSDADVVIRVQWGQTATWRLNGRNFSLTAGAQTQRCSQHLFIRKLWDGQPQPPANLDYLAFELRLRMQSNPNEPGVMNSGVSRCRYQEVVSSVPGMPYGTAFVSPAVFSPALRCVYENTGLPYSVDQDGYWIPRGGTYLVEESGLPPGWYPGTGVGADQVIDFEDPATVAQCTYYPGSGTPVERPDSDGSQIPLFGRASAKWCLQPVENLSQPSQISVTKSVEPSTATGWSFDFTIDPAPPSGPATQSVTAENPTVTWSRLFPDVTYTITETGGSPGFSSGTVSCEGGGDSVQPPPGGTAECVATNAADPSQLSVTKTVTGEDAPTDWAFNFTIAPAPAGGPATARATAASPTVTFSGLDPGRTYTVTEAPAEGFALVALDCGDGTATVTPAPGEVVRCTAVNAVTPSILPPTGPTAWTPRLAALGASSVAIGVALAFNAATRRRTDEAR